MGLCLQMSAHAHHKSSMRRNKSELTHRTGRHAHGFSFGQMRTAQEYSEASDEDEDGYVSPRSVLDACGFVGI